MNRLRASHRLADLEHNREAGPRLQALQRLQDETRQVLGEPRMAEYLLLLRRELKRFLLDPANERAIMHVQSIQ